MRLARHSAYFVERWGALRRVNMVQNGQLERLGGSLGRLGGSLEVLRGAWGPEWSTTMVRPVDNGPEWSTTMVQNGRQWSRMVVDDSGPEWSRMVDTERREPGYSDTLDALGEVGG